MITLYRNAQRHHQPPHQRRTARAPFLVARDPPAARASADRGGRRRAQLVPRRAVRSGAAPAPHHPRDARADVRRRRPPGAGAGGNPGHPPPRQRTSARDRRSVCRGHAGTPRRIRRCCSGSMRRCSSPCRWRIRRSWRRSRPASSTRYCDEAAPIAIALGARPEEVPRSRAALQQYIDRMHASGVLTVGTDARLLAKEVVSSRLAALAWPLGWTNRQVTIGWLPPGIREQYGFAWDAAGARRCRRALRVLRGVRRVLPRRVAQW